MTKRRKMTTPKDAGPLIYVDSMSVFLNQWFTTYEEARAFREAEGGYLLPFKNQFFDGCRRHHRAGPRSQ